MDKNEIMNEEAGDSIESPASSVSESSDSVSRGNKNGRRLERALGPVAVGIILDGLDLATMGPLGFIIGAVAGYWICSIYRLPVIYRIAGALVAANYCILPFTRFVPLATLIGAYVRYREKK